MKNSFLFILMILVLSNLTAQTKNILHGYLLDEQGRPIVGVRLQALQSMNVFSETDKNGHFQFSVPDLGSQDLKLSILTDKYALYNTPNISSAKNTTIVSAEKQKEGVVNIFMTDVLQMKNGQELNAYEFENELKSNTDLSSPSQPIALNHKVYSRGTLARTDTPTTPTVVAAIPDKGELTHTERGIADAVKIYEVQIAAVSQENMVLKTKYEQLTGKEIKIKNKNGRFIYVIPVNSAQEGRELIDVLSNPQMELQGIKQPFMIVSDNIGNTTKPQIVEKKEETPVKVAPITREKTPEPKVMPVPVAPAPPATKAQFIIQLQSSRFPMNSVAKRMLEADLEKIGEKLYEFNDPNADIKYRYYVMKKFASAIDAETLKIKLNEAGIQSLILTDKNNISFK